MPTPAPRTPRVAYHFPHGTDITVTAADRDHTRHHFPHATGWSIQNGILHIDGETSGGSFAGWISMTFTVPTSSP